MPRAAVDDNKRMNLRLRPGQKATLMRAAAEVGGVVLIIDAKNDRADPLVHQLRCCASNHKPLVLVIPLATFAAHPKVAGQL